MKQLLAFVRKEFLHVFRDRKTLLLLFGLPIVQILLFGFALSNEVRNSKMVICDYARDAESMKLTNKFAASNYFDIEQTVASASQLETAFKQGNVKLALVIPANFANDLAHTNHVQLQLITDASDPNTATTLTGYATNIIKDFQQQLIRNASIPYQVETSISMIYNPQLKGTTNFVPGVMALVLLLVCVLMTSVSIVKEKETGTMEILLASPFNPLLVVLSKMIPYFVVSIINLIIILLLSVFLLDMPVKGSLVLLFGESCLLILTALALGLLVSNVASSQQEAMIISLMGMLLPTIIFTGFMFPLQNMPRPLQVISNIVPSKWYYIIIKAIMIKGLGIKAIWKETVILFGMMLFLLTISIKKFKTRVA